MSGRVNFSSRSLKFDKDKLIVGHNISVTSHMGYSMVSSVRFLSYIRATEISERLGYKMNPIARVQDIQSDAGRQIQNMVGLEIRREAQLKLTFRNAEDDSSVLIAFLSKDLRKCRRWGAVSDDDDEFSEPPVI